MPHRSMTCFIFTARETFSAVGNALKTRRVQDDMNVIDAYLPEDHDDENLPENQSKELKMKLDDSAKLSEERMNKLYDQYVAKDAEERAKKGETGKESGNDSANDSAKEETSDEEVNGEQALESDNDEEHSLESDNETEGNEEQSLESEDENEGNNEGYEEENEANEEIILISDNSDTEDNGHDSIKKFD